MKPQNEVSSVFYYSITMRYVLGIIFLVITRTVAQDDNISAFKEYYPISVRPELSVGLGNNQFEQILLEAKPTVY